MTSGLQEITGLVMRPDYSQLREPCNSVAGFDIGHWVVIEKPEQFNQAVTVWLAAGGRAAR